MKAPILLLTFFSGLLIGVNVNGCIRDNEQEKLLQAFKKYTDIKRVETIRISANQANALLKNRRKEFTRSNVKFRGSEWGISLDFGD